MGWNWTRTSPRVHIYYSDMWEDNFVPWIYEICDHFIGLMYEMIFKGEAPSFLERARDLISLMGDWYVGEYFFYIHIWGSNTVHLLSRIVSDIMVVQEIAYQTIIDGVFPRIVVAKRKCWPNFPLNLGFLTLQNYTHVAMLGKSIA